MSRNAISTAKRNANAGANALENARATDIEKKNPQQVASRTKSQTFPAAQDFRNAKSTGIRIMQLNMQRSAVVAGEVRQLVAERRLDILLLQKPYAGKLGVSGTVRGLGSGVGVPAIRSQYPWAAVAVSNPNFEIIFLSQLSTPHCSCAEVLTPGFTFYDASCYFLTNHLRHLERILHSLRGKRLLISIDANARSSLWGPQSSDERGVQKLIRAFGLHVVNDAAQPLTYWTTRGSSFIDATLASTEMLRFIGSWRVRPDWTSSDHSADICLDRRRSQRLKDASLTEGSTHTELTGTDSLKAWRIILNRD